MPTTGVTSAFRGGGRYLWAAGLALVVALVTFAPAVPASSALVLDWTKQAPAASPPGGYETSMVYDAATGTVVLFGGLGNHTGQFLNDTWTWNGSAWAEQAPPVSPAGREAASMAYDAATGQVVLFGGLGNGLYLLHTTWTWNGSAWAKQAPPVHPPARYGASMAYDAATGTVVLFGGGGKGRVLNDTWTWNGSAWAKQAPAASPPARAEASMAYDTATGTVVLFGGVDNGGRLLDDTWTWNGSAWAKQAPAVSPPARRQAPMAYDGATRSVLLFGGLGTGSPSQVLNDTWTWNGSAWAKQAPAASPPARYGASMAYGPAITNLVLFGGIFRNGTIPDDTWTWG